MSSERLSCRACALVGVILLSIALILGGVSIHFKKEWAKAEKDPDTYFLSTLQECSDANATIIRRNGTARTFDLISLTHNERCDPSASVFKHANGTTSVVALLGTVTGRDAFLDCTKLANVRDYVDVDADWRYRSQCSLEIKQDYDYVSSAKDKIETLQMNTWLFAGFACSITGLYAIGVVCNLIQDWWENRKLNRVMPDVEAPAVSPVEPPTENSTVTKLKAWFVGIRDWFVGIKDWMFKDRTNAKVDPETPTKV